MLDSGTQNKNTFEGLRTEFQAKILLGCLGFFNNKPVVKHFDFLMRKDKQKYLIEVKSQKSDSLSSVIYSKKQKMISFAEEIDAIPLVVIKNKKKKTWVIRNLITNEVVLATTYKKFVEKVPIPLVI
jgi:hypothetical protein